MATRVLYVLASALCVVMARTTIAKQGGHKSHTAQEGRIIGGKPATLGQFPHMAAIDDLRSFVCGGSLISRRSILTAAHCLHMDGPFRIHLGIVKREDMGPTSWVSITHYSKCHPEFNSTGLIDNDVAIIYLMDEAPVTKYIKPVALPSFDEIGDTFLKRNTILSGWGRTRYEGSSTQHLQWAEAIVISNEVCKMFYKPGQIIDSTLCVHDIESGSCYGDSGSPLVIETSTGYKQIGVVSHGPTHCELNIPRFYARVTSFLEWIIKYGEWRK